MSSQTPTSPDSTGRFVLQYLIYLIGGGVQVFAAYWAHERFAGYQGSSGNAMGLILPTVAGMSTAAGWYSKHKTRPGSGQLWKLALICGLITILINAAIIVVYYQTGLLQEALGGQPLSSEDLQIFAGVLAVIGVLLVLLIRMGMWFGFGTAAKQEQKLVAKQAGK